MCGHTNAYKLYSCVWANVYICVHTCVCLWVCLFVCVCVCAPVWIKARCTLVKVTIRCLATPTRGEQAISLVTTASQGGVLNGGPRSYRRQGITLLTKDTQFPVGNARQIQGRLMTLLGHTVSPASLLPVATCCYRSVLWPETHRKKKGCQHRHLEEAAVGTEAAMTAQ